MNLIDRLRRSYVDHGTNHVQEAAAALERLAREKHEAQDCFDAAKEEIDRLTAEEKMQLEQIVNQGLEIERLTAHDQFLADANKQWMADCERLTAERDALKDALQLIKANTNTADWPDDINAAIQGAGK